MVALDPAKVLSVLMGGEWVSVVDGTFEWEPLDGGQAKPEEEFAFSFTAQDSVQIIGRLSAISAVRQRP